MVNGFASFSLFLILVLFSFWFVLGDWFIVGFLFKGGKKVALYAPMAFDPSHFPWLTKELLSLYSYSLIVGFDMNTFFDCSSDRSNPSITLFLCMQMILLYISQNYSGSSQM